MKKMIFTDMDGTLLNQKKELSNANLEAIREASMCGIPVIFSTGRLWTATKPYYREAGLSTPLSACNGAVILIPDTMEILNETPLKKDALSQILSILTKKNVYHHLYSLDTIFSKESKHTTAYYAERNKSILLEEDRVKISMISQLLSIAKSDCSVYKVMACSENQEELKRCQIKLEAIPNITITRSGKENLEIMSSCVNKGSSFQFLCRYFGVKEENAMAIGDEQNDLPMLQKAGFSVAMDNAPDEIKNAAKYIAPDCKQSGFAKAVHKYMKLPL